MDDSMLRRAVRYKVTDISNGLTASITNLYVTALMTEAASTSKKSVNFYHTIQCNIPEDGHFHTHRLENLNLTCFQIGISNNYIHLPPFLLGGKSLLLAFKSSLL
jgi:hypothetical protein